MRQIKEIGQKDAEMMVNLIIYTFYLLSRVWYYIYGFCFYLFFVFYYGMFLLLFYVGGIWSFDLWSFSLKYIPNSIIELYLIINCSSAYFSKEKIYLLASVFY